MSYYYMYHFYATCHNTILRLGYRTRYPKPTSNLPIHGCRATSTMQIACSACQSCLGSLASRQRMATSTRRLETRSSIQSTRRYSTPRREEGVAEAALYGSSSPRGRTTWTTGTPLSRASLRRRLTSCPCSQGGFICSIPSAPGDATGVARRR